MSLELWANPHEFELIMNFSKTNDFEKLTCDLKTKHCDLATKRNVIQTFFW